MLRLLTDNVPDLIWAKDLEGRYRFVNQAVCDKLLKCRRPEDAVGRTDQDFMQQERAAGHKCAFGQNGPDTDIMVKQNRDVGRFLEEALVRNQKLILDIHKAPFWDEQGNLIGTVGCARDVTKEKQTEIALKQSEKRYRNLYCNTPVMLFSMDHEDRVVSVSNYWLDTLGYQRDEVVGRRIIDFFSPPSRQQVLEQAFPHFYKTGQLANHPCQLITKKGDIKEVLLSTLAERDVDGNYVGAMAFMLDLTNVRAAEEKNKQLSLRLKHAQKMESIATLAGGIAHQFNNALAVILGNLELIQMDGLEDEKLKRFIAPIDEAGHRMVQLTSQLLAFARGGKFQTQTMPAHTFVRDTLQLVSHSIASIVDVETDLDENTDPIEVDQSQMQMLMAAILANASEAIEDHGHIRVSLTNVQVTEQECAQYAGLQPGRMVRLRIEDSGHGMEEEIRARIFEPFFTTKFAGRGLGMAAVYGIVKKHNGFIYVDSKLDEGTTVTIYLPCAPPVAAVKEEVPLYTASHTGTALIIEDEAMVLEVSRAIVEKLGYRVLEAASGKAAVELAQNYPGRIDVALLDIILPDMNGNQIYPLLMKARPDLKVIVCTGFAQDGPAEEILNAGADSFIQKPFNASTISLTLKQLFQTGQKSADQ
jgi:two-component system cell cycle sensor histidine kinase/response regulator CckA